MEILNLTENEILAVINKVLSENRKVIKVGGNGGQAPMPNPMLQPMGGDSNMQQPMDGMNPIGGDANMPMDDTTINGDTSDMGSESEFDTNFDAGVEADEDADPKKYIQQLTGKLSQTLNSFNNEQGEDAGLCKYVAAMIIKATCKFLDDKAKKELIEKINSAESDDADMEEPDENMEGNTEGMEGGDESMDMAPEENPEQQPVMEAKFSKKEIMEWLNGSTDGGDKRPAEIKPKTKNKLPKAWSGKKFNK